ncbi:MAG: hypothetical protein A3C79_01010 [Candidatus Taylorbacteria bacterium RIFCSPHIGHO2_02_FULL_45_28]|nr:MAG: hypothetical protein A2830_02260 [Candidatus Taylorbacteria bacterium RIFCSPHIGHO2_01_FULL_44_110]OHA25600.1 MAG: hypothetical protein A3C79_01010 [Candidatus Taylorbacteria bacterium RIFCSPHIGHO2_02_FULL_45_28]OHA39183.1 MAG: hypothetical protein A3I98_01935 [Candidatus Taylorbacteria bacterium RIFCSPLOWO2_02_FULL_45_10b]OHA45016.1 MAG: hypothetical protein A3G04_01310 [Candidatus Taylorbacteria bacterium RIFCSPLOWO2_12_FULL_44_9]
MRHVTLSVHCHWVTGGSAFGFPLGILWFGDIVPLVEKGSSGYSPVIIKSQISESELRALWKEDATHTFHLSKIVFFLQYAEFDA